MSTEVGIDQGAGRRPTMGDVAQRVGVSRQLVGIVFRNDRGVSAETRARILQAADELGYQPDVAAQTLRQRSSNYLGVVFSPAHASEVDIVDAIYPAAAADGYRVVLSALTSTRDTAAAVDEVLGYRCAALLVIGRVMKNAGLQRLSAKLPVVLIGTGGAKDTGCDYVQSAGDIGMRLMVDHLFDLGHRDIAYLYGGGMASADLRYRGYRSAVKRHRLSARVVRIIDDYTEESGARAARLLLDADTFPTAVMASNDHAAVGFIHTVLQAGLRIPQDVSVTGYDDSPVARLSYVGLTTVHQDGQQMAQASVAAALSRVDGRNTPLETIIEPALTIRASTAPPRGTTRLQDRPN